MKRSRRFSFRKLITTGLAAFVCTSCVSPKTVGGFEISGVVVDQETGTPIPNVRVRATFSAVNHWYGDALAGDTTTDENVLFKFYAAKRTMVGGIGGLSGHISAWPDLTFEKAGYCAQGMQSADWSPNTRPPPDEHEGLRIELEVARDQCYERFDSER